MRRHLCLLVLLLRWVCMSLTTTCRYQELAELAMRWLQSHADVAGSQAQDLKRQAPKEAARSPPLLEQMAHEVYRVVLFGVFYLQVSLLGYVPYVGADITPAHVHAATVHSMLGILCPRSWIRLCHRVGTPYSPQTLFIQIQALLMCNISLTELHW